jgi:hypothetical protein
MDKGRSEGGRTSFCEGRIYGYEWSGKVKKARIDCD